MSRIAYLFEENLAICLTLKLQFGAMLTTNCEYAIALLQVSVDAFSVSRFRCFLKSTWRYGQRCFVHSLSSQTISSGMSLAQKYLKYCVPVWIWLNNIAPLRCANANCPKNIENNAFLCKPYWIIGLVKNVENNTFRYTFGSLNDCREYDPAWTWLKTSKIMNENITMCTQCSKLL